ncbi:hypothetical protein E6H36_02800 [Candidatus Bathyarchaeota archaeon]|nr:MAG: hypothetical protein AUJ07_00040 [Crenarchaeota archaeon 13_1_40CM_3_53_5]TMI27567.1 MAG: hypothetical protein E6H36_02800 [Candidatus Bathyarchaeota archaeon]TMI30975.1 MAG: hypothetical protein E6H29_06100 [Candidatus Bathyarchaeota archaeon]
MPKTSRRAKRSGSKRDVELMVNNRAGNSGSPEAIKAAEHVALQAFASGLKLAAALGSVAAKTTSLALTSLATGADKFSELVREETLKNSSKPARGLNHRDGRHTRQARKR